MFWDITPFSSLKIDLRYAGICYLHLQGTIISQARNQHEVDCKKSSDFLFSLLFSLEEAEEIFL
jgi:hypothetical protein